MDILSALIPSQCSESIDSHSMIQSTIAGETRDSPRSHLSLDKMGFEVPIIIISKMHILLSTQHGSIYNLD